VTFTPAGLTHVFANHVNASFELALGAARGMTGVTHYPDRTLYVVATPIGNLATHCAAAAACTRLMDAIACEDTRHS
jgi:16S rRNA (cytidine1402-2'-O)-methyltransferase